MWKAPEKTISSMQIILIPEKSSDSEPKNAANLELPAVSEDLEFVLQDNPL